MNWKFALSPGTSDIFAVVDCRVNFDCSSMILKSILGKVEDALPDNTFSASAEDGSRAKYGPCTQRNFCCASSMTVSQKWLAPACPDGERQI